MFAEANVVVVVFVVVAAEFSLHVRLCTVHFSLPEFTCRRSMFFALLLLPLKIQRARKGETLKRTADTPSIPLDPGKQEERS